MESQELLFRTGVPCLNYGEHSPAFSNQLVKDVKGKIKTWKRLEACYSENQNRENPWLQI